MNCTIDCPYAEWAKANAVPISGTSFLFDRSLFCTKKKRIMWWGDPCIFEEKNAKGQNSLSLPWEKEGQTDKDSQNGS